MTTKNLHANITVWNHYFFQNMKKLSHVLFVVDITRALSNETTTKDLLGEHFRRQMLMDGQYRNISVVCTKSDNIGKRSEIERYMLFYPVEIQWCTNCVTYLTVQPVILQAIINTVLFPFLCSLWCVHIIWVHHGLEVVFGCLLITLHDYHYNANLPGNTELINTSQGFPV